MPSRPVALFIFKERKIQLTLRAEITMEGIGLVRRRVGGSGALELLKEELAEKREPKRIALLVGDKVVELSGQISGGKLELQMLKIFFFFWIRTRNIFQKS